MIVYFWQCANDLSMLLAYSDRMFFFLNEETTLDEFLDIGFDWRHNLNHHCYYLFHRFGIGLIERWCMAMNQDCIFKISRQVINIFDISSCLCWWQVVSDEYGHGIGIATHIDLDHSVPCGRFVSFKVHLLLGIKLSGLVSILSYR